MVFAITLNLKTARLKSGLYQKDVAIKAGITPNAYAQIENGKKTSGKTAKAICDALNLEFDDLFEIVESPAS